MVLTGYIGISRAKNEKSRNLLRGWGSASLRVALSSTRDFILVLMLYRDHQAEEVEAAVKRAVENGVSSSAGVKHLLLPSSCGEPCEPVKGWPATEPADVSVYAQLGGLS
jgi:hypothetical protein